MGNHHGHEHGNGPRWWNRFMFIATITLALIMLVAIIMAQRG